MRNNKPELQRRPPNVTALNAYIRLESTGLWRAAPGVQRRDVYVFLGDASLVVADKTETALSHWSLPAIERQNPGQMPALFAPGSDAGETLEIDDADMIAAIEQVQTAIHAHDPKPGRLRLWAGLMMSAAFIGLAIFWLPSAVITHAERVVPTPKRAELGTRVLGFVEQLAGEACTDRAGQAELRRLARRLSPQAPPRLVVLDTWPGGSGHLPGGIILLDRVLIDAHDTPDVLAGHVVVEQTRMAQTTPLSDLLRDAGVFNTLRFLATGEIPDDALQHHAEQLISSPPLQPDSATLLASFEAARIQTRPYAETLSGQDALKTELIARDPYVAGAAPMILTDNAWVTLQSICETG